MEHENKPLTLEELCQMDGQPVWSEDEERFCLVSVADVGTWKGIPFVRFCENGVGFEYSCEKRGLKLYACKPIDLDKWGPCHFCKKKSCDNCECGYDTTGENENCANCIEESEWKPVYEFCPFCGRPLTPAAREMLERRLRG